MSRKTDISTIQTFAATRGIQLLSETYADNKTPLLWRCLHGHEWEAIWTNFRRGSGCPHCAGQVLDKQKIETTILAQDGKLLSPLDSILNNKTKFQVQCKAQHTWLINWANLQGGKWCPFCAGNTKKSLDEVRNSIQQLGGELISKEYTNAFQLLQVRCSEGHSWSVKWNNLQTGKWCPTCSHSGTSRLEQEVVDVVKLLLPTEEVLHRYKVPGTAKEFDVFIPSKNLAIEFHGLIWHSERFSKNLKETKTKHVDKYLLAKEQGITLVQIFEDEWLSKKEIILSMLKNRLGISLGKVFARETEVRQVASEESNRFFDANHVAGTVRSSKAFGLYKEGRLVCCLSLRKPFIKKYDGFAEIARFASELDVQIVGGFQKILKVAAEWAKQEGYLGILTYSDLRFGEGHVYAKSGFDPQGRTVPNYFYEKNGVREGRFKRRKSSSLPGVTEREQNNLQGWYAIYDAGSNIYTKTF